MNLLYRENRLLISFGLYVILVMVYIATKELFIPTLKPVDVVDTKTVVMLLNKNIQMQNKKEEQLKQQKIQEENEIKEREQKLQKEKEEKLTKEKEQKEKEEKAQKEKAQKEKLLKEKQEKEKLQKLQKEREKKEREQREKLERERMQRKIDEETVYTEAVYNNNALNNPYPKYPIISKKEGEEGEVILLVKVGTDGRAVDIKIYKSSGYERLDNASLYAVKYWHFIPAKNKFGTPIESYVKIPFVFKIRNAT